MLVAAVIILPFLFFSFLFGSSSSPGFGIPRLD
jgi:hypothetical protein